MITSREFQDKDGVGALARYAADARTPGLHDFLAQRQTDAGAVVRRVE
jgi:hypothetical protein